MAVACAKAVHWVSPSLVQQRLSLALHFRRKFQRYAGSVSSKRDHQTVAFTSAVRTASSYLEALCRSFC